MTDDAAQGALDRATQLLDVGAYGEVARVLAVLRQNPATSARRSQLDLAEELLLECVQLTATSEEHQIAAEQARRRRDVLRSEVISILQLSVGAAVTGTEPSKREGAVARQGRDASDVVRPRSSRVQLSIHFFGEFETYIDDRPVTQWHGLKARAVLQLLVLNAPRTVGVDALIDALWPDSDDEAGRRNVHQAMYMLRKSLRATTGASTETVTFERPDYRLSPHLDVWSDVAEFEQSVTAGRNAVSQRLLDGLPDLERAIGLYRGEFLENALYDEWTFRYRDRFRREFTEAAMTLFSIYSRLERLDPLIELAHRVVHFDSCNETAHRALMEAYDAQGKRHLAIQQFHTCEQELARNLGVEPAPETQRLMRGILAKR